MAAKLIFYKNPDTNKETFQFCPLVKVGCEKCFLPPKCKGENDTHVVFDLDLKRMRMTAIRTGE